MASDRVRCGRCGANNFVGQPACWSCKGSLPPPEALGQSPMPRAAEPHAQARAYRPAASRTPVGVFVGVAAAVMVIGLLLVGAYTATKRRPAPAPATEALQQLERQQEKMSRDPSPAVSNPYDLDPNSPENQARRELRRLENKLEQKRSQTGPAPQPSGSPAADGGIIPPSP